MLSLHQIGLLLHIIGLTTIAGVTLAHYIMSAHFYALYTQHKPNGLTLIETRSRCAIAARIGLLLLIVSGVMMMGPLSEK
jgi:hypothetical protein